MSEKKQLFSLGSITLTIWSKQQEPSQSVAHLYFLYSDECDDIVHVNALQLRKHISHFLVCAKAAFEAVR